MPRVIREDEGKEYRYPANTAGGRRSHLEDSMHRIRIGSVPPETREFFERFVPVRLEDRPALERFAEGRQVYSGRYGFTTLFAWAEVDRTFWRTYRNTLLIYEEATDTFLMPWGEPLPPRELADLADHFGAAGKCRTIERVPPDYLQRYPEVEEYFECLSAQDGTEYVYSTGALAELAGGHFKNHRNQIHHFERQCVGYEVLPLGPGLTSQCLALEEKWLTRKERGPVALRERTALRRALTQFRVLGLEGLAIRLDDRLLAFSIFCRGSASMYFSLFEKCDVEVPGVGPAMVRAVAAALRGRCTYMNWDDDVGSSSLRQAKLSYMPELLLEHVVLRRRPRTAPGIARRPARG